MKHFVIGFCILLLLLVVGCAGKRHYSSSLMDYLYPTSQPSVAPRNPLLSLPIKVGIAFVPNRSSQGTDPFSSWTMHPSWQDPVSEKERMDLLERIAAEFRKYDYIEGIELIPSAYLAPSGGYDNLNQLRSLFGIDVIALVSSDQVQNTDEGLMSFSYWTIIGAYLVRGEKNSTNTLLDTAVFHIPSRSLLFRAPGTSYIAGKATPVNLDEQLKQDAVAGLNQAAELMVANLQQELAKFEEKVKSQPEKYKIEHRTGGGYSGAFDPGFSLLLLLGGIAALAWRRCEKTH